LKINLKLAQSSLDPLLEASLGQEEKSTKDKFLSYNKYLDKYNDFSFNNRKIIKEKYLKKMGIYLWLNNINNKSYVGKSVDLFNRLNKNYLSNSYIFKNKEKMAICSAIYKYGIDKFSFYILEIIEKPELDLLSYKELLSIRENYWHSIINPSYNIQTILNPFTGINHYRFGKKVIDSIRSKISKSLKGRIKSETEKIKHVLGAHKQTKKFMVTIGILILSLWYFKGYV
jgi:group I intron endonuclease